MCVSTIVEKWCKGTGVRDGSGMCVSTVGNLKDNAPFLMVFACAFVQFSARYRIERFDMQCSKKQ